MTTTDLVAVLKDQRAQLERLLQVKVWISDAPKATVEEMNAQVTHIKSLIQELDDVIQARRR